MKSFPLSISDVTVSSVILGLMRIKIMSDAEIRTLYAAARDVGINMIDHADIYEGERHLCERRFGEAITFSAAERDSVVIQTKTGIRKQEGLYDLSKEHILKSVDESLVALNTDYIDVLLLHRPDTLVEPEEVAAAFDVLEQAGKGRQFGVSNHTPGQVELLKTAVKQKLVANQVQLSITHANLFAQGIAANINGLEQSISRDNDILNYSRINKVTLQAWSPFQKGWFDGVFLGDSEHYGPLNDAINEIAASHGVTATGIAVAWITRHPANIQVVLGTTNPERVRDGAGGSDVTLSREEWYRLFTAAGHKLP
ncbi:aldo/keto reductase family oxidoreductase [Mesorhizobium sp. GbtcB19]|uniref:aldo/keto reductase n=1 Tax=Mesorhizobium sp. GbtcB19 TaxID=2824764 RepID=UPI001C308A9E|nr:aldo/keto reductase [Mesorhizobium sp. GbtcB19]